MVPLALILGCILQLAVLLFHLPQSQAERIIPNIHTLPDGLQTVNGSDPLGGCGLVLSIRVCHTGSDSHLFDNDVPTVECFEDDWAAGFFTVRSDGMGPIMIGFRFNITVNVSVVQLTVLNSPSQGIGTPSEIVVYGSTQFPEFDLTLGTTHSLGNAFLTASSCDSLHTINIDLAYTGSLYRAYFIELNASTEWVFIAEVTFYSNQITDTSSSISISPIVCPTQTTSFCLEPTSTVSQAMQTASESPGARKEGDQGSSTTIAIVSPSTTTPTSNIPTTTAPFPPNSASDDNVAMIIGQSVIIGILVGGVVFGVLAIVVVTISIVVLSRARKRQPPQFDGAVYDEVGPPRLPPRKSAEVAMELNIAYASNIQVERNTAYAGNIQVEANVGTVTDADYCYINEGLGPLPRDQLVTVN